MLPQSILELTPEEAMAHLAAIVESSDDAIISKTLDGTIRFWNRGAELLYGFTPAEAIGSPMSLLLPLGRANEENEILQRIGLGERVDHFETVRRRKNGELIHVSLTISPIRDLRGRIIGASHIARNITDRKQLDDQSAHLAAIVKSSEDAVISKTLEGIILSWNAGAERVYGYAAEDAIGRPMTLLLPSDRENEEAQILEQIRRGQQVRHFETVRRKNNGELIDVSLTISPISDERGRIMGASHIARDITERKRLEQRLQQVAAIVESSDDAIISKTLDGIILTWNAGAEHVYGYSAREMIGRPMTLLLPDDRQSEESEVLERIRRGESVEHFETVRRMKSGSLIDVSITISPVRDAAGRIIGGSHVARNVTERKQLEEQLRHTQKLESLGVLAGGVAHDFNNLLTGILGNASLALESMSPHDPTTGLLRDVVSASERASHLTRQLLAYAGKGRFLVEPVNLSGLVREISRLIQSSIPRNVELRLDLRDDVPSIQADASQLQQLIMNLVINGAEAIPPNESGTVLVTIGIERLDESCLFTTLGRTVELPAGTYVALDVRDSGCGMDESTMNRMFDPFFTTKFTGRGLGLAAVQGIVRAHKGTMKVESGPGKGTLFRILFPAIAESPASRPPAAPRIAASNGLILVVDDEEIIRRTAKAMLERYGFGVVLAEDGKEGVELFQVLSEKVSLVLLDMTMPVMNGEDAFDRLRAIRPDIKVILSSGYNEVEAVRRFTGKGLSGFIQKPYSSVALGQKIKSVLETR